ncbi:hypothetical protein PDESU_03360 [Pontiella desulfatans]|uniref:Uncharacterized protein n=1 Tax=Pontiella desulfatans TaxID=2750659 RepID=A0A6C2U5H7_PONDE|nr:hypothetical protein [Pontiella desulfatans]VGO14791.1 hypothetical protein PDESU_03360 [Pontiella desulfatans]
MNTLQADRVVKAIVDGEDEYATIAELSGVEPQELVAQSETIDRAIQLMRGFYKYGHENMKPAGLPPPRNPYFDMEKGIDEQCPEYFAFEAVQRNGMDRERCIWTCGQFGLDSATAETALDNVIIPWRGANGWKTYARRNASGHLVLQDKPPVKLKRHLEKLIQSLV